MTDPANGLSTDFNYRKLTIFMPETRPFDAPVLSHLQTARAFAKAPAGTPIDWAAEAIAFALPQLPLNASVWTALWARPLTMPEHCAFGPGSLHEL